MHPLEQEWHAYFVIFITDQPENVRLTKNTTSRVCTGVVINFTCTAEANPAVHTYLLYENGTLIENIGISGTWIKTIDDAGQFVFRCEANNSFPETGRSDHDTILFVDGEFEVIQLSCIFIARHSQIHCVSSDSKRLTRCDRRGETGLHV